MCLATVMAACALAACTKPEALAWEGDCRFVEQTISWHPIEMTVPEGPARTIRLYLRLQQGTGTVWFDSVEAPGLNVVNPSFEEASGNKIADWGQDDVGQTIFVDESRAAYGQRSVRITRTQPGQSRIWQDLRTEAGRAYKIRVWAQWKDISDGTAYGEVYVINPDGSHDGIIASTQRLTGSSQPIVRRWWEVAADGNTARVARCSLTVAQLGTYRLDVPADTSGLNGTAVVELRTGDGRVSRASLSPAEGWQTVSLHAPIDDSAQVTVSVSGNGTVRLATPVLRRPDLVPLPQQLKWLSPSENFALRGEVPIVVPPTASGAQLTGPNWLAREIRQKAAAEVKLVKTDQYEGRAICIGGPLAMQKLQAAGITVPPKPEGYAVAVRHDLVAAAGHDDPGTFYAAITLLWLLQQVGEQTEIIAADVVDFPELPFRGTYGLYGGDLLAAVETCAR
ncbi:MAG: hypothetical protein H5T86_14320, partial [Armatimonadetes bacterium]|nr:hypothetical protein [Armatimonadota bacterium]